MWYFYIPASKKGDMKRLLRVYGVSEGLSFDYSLITQREELSMSVFLFLPQGLVWFLAKGSYIIKSQGCNGLF